ncbi:hypothetical protein C8F01DRAFT_1136543 [Mycena amicta]|nr:hypothetical protein C8F01DRAFT_1136543 [Mycena amicta]
MPALHKLEPISARLQDVMLYQGPLERLPVEIWALIFTHVLPPIDGDPRIAAKVPLLLSAICTTLRTIAQSTAELWTSLSIRCSRVARRMDVFTNWICHSRGRIVSLHIQGPIKNKAVLGFLLPHVEHLHYLDIVSGPIPNTIPALQLYCLFRDATQLRRVSLCDIRDAWSDTGNKWTKRVVEPLPCNFEELHFNGAVAHFGLANLFEFSGLRSLSCRIRDDFGDSYDAMRFIQFMEYWKCELHHLKLVTPPLNRTNPWSLLNVSWMLNYLTFLTHLEFSSPSISVDHNSLLKALAGDSVYMFPPDKLPCPGLVTLDLTLALALDYRGRIPAAWGTALVDMLSARRVGPTNVELASLIIRTTTPLASKISFPDGLVGQLREHVVAGTAITINNSRLHGLDSGWNKYQMTEDSDSLVYSNHFDVVG